MLASSKLKCSKRPAFPKPHYGAIPNLGQSVKLFCAYIIFMNSMEFIVSLCITWISLKISDHINSWYSFLFFSICRIVLGRLFIIRKWRVWHYLGWFDYMKRQKISHQRKNGILMCYSKSCSVYKWLFYRNKMRLLMW